MVACSLAREGTNTRSLPERRRRQHQAGLLRGEGVGLIHLESHVMPSVLFFGQSASHLADTGITSQVPRPIKPPSRMPLDDPMPVLASPRSRMVYDLWSKTE